MEKVILIFQNGQQFLIPFTVVIITQIIKTAIQSFKKGRIKLSYLAFYGHMPSAHTALFTSLAVILYLKNGWQSPIFALAFLICLVMIRDALGIRHHLGNHGLILKQLIQEQEAEGHTKIKHDKIVTRLGHTPMEVLVGAILGTLITLILYIAIN